MGDAELKEHLKNLHEELKAARAVDTDSEELLRQVAADVQSLLSNKGELQPTVHYTGIRERMLQAAERFDVSHPSLASLLTAVVNSLNSLGI